MPAGNADFLQGLSDQRRKDFQSGDAAKPVDKRGKRAPKAAATQPAGGTRTALAQDTNPDKARDEVDRTTDAQVEQQQEQLDAAKDSTQVKANSAKK